MTAGHGPVDARVRASFERQSFMTLLGARLTRIAPGEVDIELPYRGDLVQQHGFLHAGVVTSIADSACGYAALTTMPGDSAVLSAEFKINLLAPASGDEFIARGRVLRAGRTLVVCRADVFARADGVEKLVAAMQGTMVRVPARAGVQD